MALVAVCTVVLSRETMTMHCQRWTSFVNALTLNVGGGDNALVAKHFRRHKYPSAPLPTVRTIPVHRLYLSGLCNFPLRILHAALVHRPWAHVVAIA